MSKICPISQVTVLYTECLDCDDRISCRSGRLPDAGVSINIVGCASDTSIDQPEKYPRKEKTNVT